MPILYSLHNCPYAIRARLALIKAQQPVLLRSIKLENKPEEMLVVSAKGSVPVLVVTQQDLILEESLEIMVWALLQHDPYNLLKLDAPEKLPEMLAFIEEFECNAVPAFNAFSCAKRYHENNTSELLSKCEIELARLELLLTQYDFLGFEQESLVDIALMPFLRKFARINKPWFRQCRYPKLRLWLNRYLQSREFSIVMKRYELWVDNRKDDVFG